MSSHSFCLIIIVIHSSMRFFRKALPPSLEFTTSSLISRLSKKGSAFADLVQAHPDDQKPFSTSSISSLPSSLYTAHGILLDGKDIHICSSASRSKRNQTKMNQ